MDQEAVNAMQELMDSEILTVKDQALWWLRYRRTNEWSSFYMKIPELEVTISPELQKEMLALKVKIEDKSSSRADHKNAVSSMAKNITGGKMLVGMAAQNKLSQELIDEASKFIFNNPDQSVRVLAGDYFKNPMESPSMSITKIAGLSGDAVKGKTVFQGKCATCHRIGNEGRETGPGLGMIGAKLDKSGLLDAIINPSAGMAFGYEMWLLQKNDGTVAMGFLQVNGETVILKGMNEEVYYIKSSDIAYRKQFSTSIMPEPSALGLGEEDLANLSEYLLTLKSGT